MKQGFAIALIAGGVYLLFSNRWISQKAIEFQQAIGGIWSGQKSYLMGRAITIVLGCYLIAFGFLLLIGRLS